MRPLLDRVILLPKLPKIPEELVQDIDPRNPGVLIRDYPGWLVLNGDTSFKVTDNPFYKVSDELVEWLKANITDVSEDIGVRYAFGSPDQPSAGIHTDQTRSFVLQYHLRTGNGTLCYWEKKNSILKHLGSYERIDNYNKVKRIGQIDVPVHMWHLIDARELHSVEGLIGTRVTIQISLNEIPAGLVENNK